MPEGKREAWKWQHPNGYWYIRWQENGKPCRTTAGTKDEGEAEQFLADWLEIHQHPETESITVNYCLDEYLKHKARVYGTTKGRHYTELVYALKPIRARFGMLAPQQCTPRASRSYTDKRRDLGRSDATIGKELSILNAALNYAVKEQIVPHKQFFVELPPAPPPKERWLKDDEIIRLFDQFKSPHVRMFALLALHTAARKTAILELKWSQVDMENRVIHYNPAGRRQTNKRRVSVPINSSLYAGLETCLTLAKTEYVVEFGRKPVKDIKRAFNEAAERAGMPDVTPHALRRTGATRLVRKGVNLKDVADLLGDSLRTVMTHYLKHSPEHLREAVKAMEDIAA